MKNPAGFRLIWHIYKVWNSRTKNLTFKETYMKKSDSKKPCIGLEITKCFTAVFCLCSFAVFAIAPVSCKMTEEGVEIQSGDKSCPTVENFETTDSSTVTVTCSEEVVITDVTLTKENTGSEGGTETDKTQAADKTAEVEEKQESEEVKKEGGSNENGGVKEEAESSENPDDAAETGSKTETAKEVIPIESITYENEGKTAQITLGEETKTGESYILSAVITDSNGNSVDYEQSFAGFNENPAVLILSEIRTKADSKKSVSDFIEFYCLKGGNTHGITLYSAYAGKDCDYAFPAMEVKTGEYITLHNRTYDEEKEKAVSETGEDLTLSKANESSSSRDLWREGTEAKTGVTGDVLVLKNTSTGKIYDGILFSKAESQKWSRKLQKEYAETLYSSGIWKSGSGVESAFKSDKTDSVYRSISRKNIEELARKYTAGNIESVQSSAADWALTEKTGSKKTDVSGATPGLPNSTNYYIEGK